MRDAGIRLREIPDTPQGKITTDHHQESVLVLWFDIPSISHVLALLFPLTVPRLTSIPIEWRSLDLPLIHQLILAHADRLLQLLQDTVIDRLLEELTLPLRDLHLVMG